MIHTFVILAYKESEYLESCINSVINQSVKSKIMDLLVVLILTKKKKVNAQKK